MLVGNGAGLGGDGDSHTLPTQAYDTLNPFVKYQYDNVFEYAWRGGLAQPDSAP
jgi:hypothetical protein